jgi:predicted nucleotidyltransferase
MIRRAFEDLQERLLAEVKTLYSNRLVSLVLFGSVARGTPGPESDIDFLIVADPLPNGRMRRVAEFEAAEGNLGPYLQTYSQEGVFTCLSPVFKTPAEVKQGSLLFLDMVDDARIVYDRNGFFERYLNGLRKRLQDLGARKIQHAGAWYWDLKPDFRKGDIIEL